MHLCEKKRLQQSAETHHSMKNVSSANVAHKQAEGGVGARVAQR